MYTDKLAHIWRKRGCDMTCIVGRQPRTAASMVMYTPFMFYLWQKLRLLRNHT